MQNNNQIQIIENKIFTIRGQQVMLDEDLASIYEVKTLRLNEQVKRNPKRFPLRYWEGVKFEKRDNFSKGNSKSRSYRDV
jgi:hypothetical protein